MDTKDPREERRKAYRRIAKDLQEEERKVEETSQHILQQRLKTFQKELERLIAPPPELVARTLLVKKIVGFPPTLEGIETFKEPKRMKTGEFQARLAVDLISYGIHIQRTKGRLLTVEAFVETFLHERYWWDTTPETVQKVLRTLINEGVVTTTADEEMVFEPIELSREIGQVLGLAEIKGVLSSEEACTQLNWTPEKVHYVLEQLKKEGIAIWDMKERLYYFPALVS